MNKQDFYAALRSDKRVFGTSIGTNQVATMEHLIRAIQSHGLSDAQAAYVFATAYHEPGPRSRMVPNRENMNYSSARQLVRVWPSRFNATNAAAFVNAPQALANKVYNGRLGNRKGTNDGWIYRGGGLDHTTGRENYRKNSAYTGVDLVAHPERILEPAVAADCIVSGMVSGRYTGKKLAHYINDKQTDFINARRIINGASRYEREKVEPWVKGYAEAFLSAIEDGGGITAAKAPTLPPAPRKTGWGDVLAAILKLFGARK